jgi:hypothetical protein
MVSFVSSTDHSISMSIVAQSCADKPIKNDLQFLSPVCSVQHEEKLGCHVFRISSSVIHRGMRLVSHMTVIG